VADLLPIPPAIRRHLVELVQLRFSTRDPEPALAALPDALPAGTVVRLATGGAFGWLIEGRLDEIDGRVALEALEDSRMAGPEHYRVWDDGSIEALPNEHIGYGLPANHTPADQEHAQAEYYEHNHAVQQLLRERGFLGGR
jgi:hypothetical protein